MSLRVVSDSLQPHNWEKNERRVMFELKYESYLSCINNGLEKSKRLSKMK